LTASGEWIGGNVLADPGRSTAVRVRGGFVTRTDGPDAEVKEHVAGYTLVECDSLERAVAIAATIPDARISGVEVRPLMEPGGMEM
jgi:hypothetical protein